MNSKRLLKTSRKRLVNKTLEVLMINTRKYFVVDVALLALGACVAVGWFYWKRNLPPPTLPKDTLPESIRNTQNIISALSGKISAANNNSIDIVVNVPTSPVAKPTGKPVLNTATFHINVPSTTRIVLSTSEVPYLFKKSIATKRNIQLSELHSGQYVSVQVSGDIRKLDSDRLDAVTIQTSALNSITGKVVGIDDKSILTIEAFPPTPLYTFNPVEQSGDKVRYQITITKDTEISYYGVRGTVVQSPERYDPSQFTIGSQLKVYTDSDLNFERTGNALRIEPLNLQVVSLPIDSPTTLVPTLVVKP
jgi:hypothetical protein